MFFISMRAYKCTVHECMYVLCTRFHFRNIASVLYVYVCVCVCDDYGVQAIDITMCKCVLAHVHALCEKYQPKVTASGTSPVCVSVCVCVCACMCVSCVCTGVYIHAHVHFV